ncbi:MAG: TraR/DksA C4-type zinc finger protein [Candidatus Saccharibacteria bacterium]
MNEDQLKVRLHHERKRLENSIRQKREAADKGLLEMTDELSMYDQHPADLGTELFEREKDAGLLELLEVELVKVDESLRKMDQGTYGICEVCGERIDPRRLESLPYALLCITCARKSQDEFPRPTEEQILNIHEIDAKGDQFEIAGYDLNAEYGFSGTGEDG